MVWCRNARSSPPSITVRTLLLWHIALACPVVTRNQGRRSVPVGGGEFSGHRMWVQGKVKPRSAPAPQWFPSPLSLSGPTPPHSLHCPVVSFLIPHRPLHRCPSCLSSLWGVQKSWCEGRHWDMSRTAPHIASPRGITLSIIWSLGLAADSHRDFLEFTPALSLSRHTWAMLSEKRKQELEAKL